MLANVCIRADVYMRINGQPEQSPPSIENSVILEPIPSSLAARLGTQYSSDPKLLHFVGSLLKVNPEERYTSAQMLAHPWLEGQKEAHSQDDTIHTAPRDDAHARPGESGVPCDSEGTSIQDASTGPNEGDPTGSD